MTASVTATKPSASPDHRRKKNLLSDGQGALAAALVSPTMLVITLVVGFPILFSVRESLFASNSGIDPSTGILQSGEQFVGLSNFTNIFTNPTLVIGVFGSMDRLVNAFLNTTFFTVVCVVAETIIGVAMAVIMSKAFRGRGLVRAAILVPWAIPTIVSAKMWALIFDANGVANKLLGQDILWLADNSYSQWAVIIADVWKTAPFIGLLTLAGLQTIPDEVYEAARVDGASAWQQFTRITLPLVQPALVVAVLFRTLDTMRMFDLPFGMIGAGKYSVETLSMFAYFENNALRYGPAAAYSIVLFLYIVVVAFLFVKLLGADVVGDPETKALAEARKRRRIAARTAKAEGRPAPQPVRSTITSGDSPT
ncbi:MAG TPA: sugar ABC transporter permease [Propioniciclava sp.]|jgi:multiple sugar transport system permease protein|uniref:carbohydrate ABC transporter permease n=1 Tax=Propioniciclava sp. TaxID=2038686 RepID=UPI002C1C4594|nr:sugar ABC transporter permease [Propioniciclava sp.]HRL49895.1 sugar ABC transporter permease [Propioniciclava sp.]HRL79645.1 sugar ABC transporter permease [Propioniciclava sp.]